MYPLSPVHNAPTDKVLPATLLMVNAGERFSKFKKIPYLKLSYPQAMTVLYRCIPSNSLQNSSIVSLGVICFVSLSMLCSDRFISVSNILLVSGGS